MGQAALQSDDLFEKPTTYAVHYHPPDYPERLFPGRCQHEPQFGFHANLEIRPGPRGRNQIEIDHAICLACGLPRPCTIGGNVLVDCQMILADHGMRHWRIALQVQHIRDKWSRIATYLFDENGWNGRHERIARLIDPRLTMKLKLEPCSGKMRLGTISFDPEYIRSEDD